MGRASAGFDFFNEMVQEQTQESAKTAPERAKEKVQQEAELQTMAIGDKKFELELPTDTLKERVPTAKTVVDQPGPNPENLFPADLSGSVQIQPSEKNIQAVKDASIPSVESEVFPTQMPQDLTDEQKIARLQDTLTQEFTMKVGMTPEMARLYGGKVDAKVFGDQASKDLDADDNGLVYLQNALEAASKSFDINNEEANLFGEFVNITGADVSKAESDPMGVLKNNSSIFSYALKGYDKLNLLVDPSNPQSEIRPEAGNAALLSVILELGNRLDKQDGEIDKQYNERQFDDALDRMNIGKAIGRQFERLIYPSLNEDPQAVYTGESEGFGYNYRLTEKEASVLGQVLIEGFASSDAFNWVEGKTIERDGKQKRIYLTNRYGENRLKNIRTAVRKSLGIAGHSRPVSNVPTSGGRLLGEGAYTQKQITTQLEKNTINVKTKDGRFLINDAVEKLSNVAHRVSPHKILIMLGVMQAGKMGTNPLLSKFTKQDSAYRRKKYNSILKEYQTRAEEDPTFNEQALGMSFSQAANREAERISNIHRSMRLDTIQDAVNRIGNPFYYGWTAINNSSRLMISNTELNYQADKVARFIVDGAKPVAFRIGSNSTAEQGFFQVLARSLVPNADKMTPARQLQEFEANKEKYIAMGQDFLNYTTANQGRLDDLKKSIEDLDGNKGIINPEITKVLQAPIQLSEGTTELLNQQGKDSFYFTMDALHELARYEAVKKQGEASGNANPTFLSRAKAEIDGNSNGAVIQAFQMGVENILKKGGVLYEDNISYEDAERLEGDIRDDVFNVMIGTEEFAKEPESVTTWHEIFKQIKATDGKVKELMKLPIMTSIYGKDPAFHGDTARTFVEDNPDFFKSFETSEQAIKELTSYLQVGLENGLGGALEHAKLAKRIGRAFGFTDRTAVMIGPNGFGVQSGGYESVLEDSISFKFGPAANLRTAPAEIQVNRRDITATAKAKGFKQPSGYRSSTKMGSKLANQFAVNGTQNIDATVAQETVTRVPDGTIMQVYDAFMGDAESFPKLRKASNEAFYDVNTNYNMLEAERDSLLDMIAKVQEEVNLKASRGESFDIGTEGKYKMLGEFIFNSGTIVTRDLINSAPGKTEAQKRDSDMMKKAYNEAKEIRSILRMSEGAKGRNLNYVDGADASILVKPETFIELFNLSIKALRIREDLNKMISEVNSKRKKLMEKIKRDQQGQYS
jgi:hypothetical protein